VHVPAALLAVATIAGCAEPPPRRFERWPIMMTTIPSPAHQFAWLSPQHPARLVMQYGDPVTTKGAITAISDSPDVSSHGWAVCGLVAFHEEGAEHVNTISREHHPLEIDGELSCARAAERVWPLEMQRPALVLIDGGTVDASVQAEDAEPAPWLLGGEVRLAWFDEGTLVLGESEIEGEANPYRIRAGWFAGEDSLLVFVYTRAPFDDVLRRRPWVYRIVESDEGVPHLEARWRGTSLSHPFRDATFCDLTGDRSGEIAALEIAEDGGRLITAYRFEGFGLEGLAPSVKPAEVEDKLEAANWVGGWEQELVVRRTDGRFVFFALDTGKLREVLTVDGPREVLGWVVTSASNGEPGDIVCVLPSGETWEANSWQFRGPHEP